MAIPEKPNTTMDFFLAAAAGQEVTLPEAVTGEQMYLKAIKERIDRVLAQSAEPQTGGGGADPDAIHGVEVNGTAVPVTSQIAEVSVNKATVGLDNVDNTRDVDKPISTAQQAALDNKVDKAAGKGLSTEDYTTADKVKLGGIPADATNNVGTITGITMNGVSRGTSGVVNLGTGPF